MAVQADPSPEAAAPGGRPTAPSRGFGSHERWGYTVWTLVGAVIAVPEIWALTGNPPWPTISATVGHLEALWPPTAVIVVALIAGTATHALRYPWRRSGPAEGRAGRAPRGRTGNGRFTRAPGETAEISAYAYFPAAVLVIAASSAVAAALGVSRWGLAYVLYGLIATLCVIVPNILAYWFSRDVPFPTLVRTVADLERRWHPAAVVIAAGLAVLLIHLAFYPWPDIARTVTTGSP